jgi:diacylglycerol kinase (ATP)
MKRRIAVINMRSGNTTDCQILLQSLNELLGEENVFDLSVITPLDVLKRNPCSQVVCCGGDGTVAWVLSALDEFVFKERPKIAVIPLGTGNDLSRSLGWGPGFHSAADVEELIKDFDSAVEKWGKVGPDFLTEFF